MSSESELESDEEFERAFSEQHLERVESCSCNDERILIKEALRKAISSGRTDRVRRLLAITDTSTHECKKDDGLWTQPVLEAAVRGNEEIFNMVWENYALRRSSFEDFHFAVTMASLFRFEHLCKALEKRFPWLGSGTCWDLNEPIMRAVEVISRPTRLSAPHYSYIKPKSCFRELLPCCWEGTKPHSMAVEVDEEDFRGQNWRRETLRRFTFAVLDGDVTEVKNIMRRGSASMFFRGDRLSDYECESQYKEVRFSCLQVLSSPFCLAIARNQREVLFELLSVFDRLPYASQVMWIKYHSRAVFDIALVQGDPSVIRTLLHFFFKKNDFKEVCIERMDAALNVVSSREDLALLGNIWKTLVLDSDYEQQELRKILKRGIMTSFRLRNRMILQLLSQPTFISMFSARGLLEWAFKFRFCSAVRRLLLLREFGLWIYVYFDRWVLNPPEWPKGVAMLYEDNILVPKVKEVRSLRHSCRIAIRGFLRQPIRDSVNKLPLPKKVRKTLILHCLPFHDLDFDLKSLQKNKSRFEDLFFE